jgi:hypothetical protein
MRPLLSVPFFCAALLLPGMAAAQDRTLLVFFQPSNEQQLNDAIVAGLSQPPFLFSPKLTPKALVLSIPDKVEVTHGHASGTSWGFNVVFLRNGDTLGQSREDCTENKLSECIDQLMSDVKTAAGVQQ